MISLDTNVLVRVLVNDDPKQARRASALIAQESVLLTPTVLLETEWVLRYTYELSREAILRAFRILLGVPTVTVRDAAAVARSLKWYAAGLDFADALHLSHSDGAAEMASFDRDFARRAARVGASPAVVELR